MYFLVIYFYFKRQQKVEIGHFCHSNDSITICLI